MFLCGFVTHVESMAFITLRSCFRFWSILDRGAQDKKPPVLGVCLLVRFSSLPGPRVTGGLRTRAWRGALAPLLSSVSRAVPTLSPSCAGGRTPPLPPPLHRWSSRPSFPPLSVQPHLSGLPLAVPPSSCLSVLAAFCLNEASGCY